MPALPPTLYLFSGLGADARVFQKLTFGHCNPVFINWIKPYKRESLAHYAGRLLPQLTAPNPMLIGLSFGGLVAVEVAKQLATAKVILLNSVKTRSELPPYFRVLGRIGLQHILPAELAKKPNALTYWAFGTSTSETKILLAQILHDTDPKFVDWAVGQLLCWKNTTLLPNLVHIHGTADRLLPIRFIQADYEITSGGHLMPLDKAEEISALLQKIIKAS
jgi:pimeloyl-ACP methyl ester carboxylesterase